MNSICVHGARIQLARDKNKQTIVDFSVFTTEKEKWEKKVIIAHDFQRKISKASKAEKQNEDIAFASIECWTNKIEDIFRKMNVVCGMRHGGAVQLKTEADAKRKIK